MKRAKQNSDEGAILVIAMVVITAVALVVGAVLTRSEGAVRTTMALREVAGSTYAAEGAAQVAINGLRTGVMGPTSVAPAGWLFTNMVGTGCFGYEDDLSPVTGLELANFYPAPKGSGLEPTSAYVECAGEAGTGDQGSAVPITNANKPGNAILTLGTDSEVEEGFTFKANREGAALRIRGGVWSNSTIIQNQNGDLSSTTSIDAVVDCVPDSAMKAPHVRCGGAPVKADPDYQSDLDLDAEFGGLNLQTPVNTCESIGRVELHEGYYDDATLLNDLTPDGNGTCLVHLNPGTYYFDFHNDDAYDDVLFDDDIVDAADNVWKIHSGTVVGGQLTDDLTVPGRCVNPIDDVAADGVQLIFGGDSRIAVDKKAQLELCASYRADRPPIVLYGQKTGAATRTVVDPDSAYVADAVTTTPETFSGASADNLRDADGDEATGSGFAVWTRPPPVADAAPTARGTLVFAGPGGNPGGPGDNPGGPGDNPGGPGDNPGGPGDNPGGPGDNPGGPGDNPGGPGDNPGGPGDNPGGPGDNPGNPDQTLLGSIMMSGFEPSEELPKGTVVTGAQLKITHSSTGAPNEVTLTPDVGTGTGTFVLSDSPDLVTEDLDLTDEPGWGAFQKSVHDHGFTGATLQFDANLDEGETSELDSARLELTYYLPSLRGQTTDAITGNTVATPGGEPVLSAIGTDTLVYLHGTTYTPNAFLQLELNNIAESVFRFGVIVRALDIFETGSFDYPGPVIELPDNSPGWGFNGTTAHLNVYLCPGQSSCSPSTGELSLTSRVQIWDPSHTAVLNTRQMSVLSWSHQR